MRVCAALITPNITTRLWARLLARAVGPCVDRFEFIMGHPDRAALRAGMAALSEISRPMEVSARNDYSGHGAELTRWFQSGAFRGATVLLLEDDCFVTCEPWHIGSLFARAEAYGVVGSRMARPGDPREHLMLDTWGDGLYPNMMLARYDLLAQETHLDFQARDGGDVGHWVGVELHRRGIHLAIEDHVPQCRMSAYPGCVPVEPGSWRGPWLHVGQMSPVPRWRACDDAGGAGYEECIAAYAAALPLAGPEWAHAIGAMADRVAWARARAQFDQTRFAACLALMQRVFEGAA